MSQDWWIENVVLEKVIHNLSEKIHPRWNLFFREEDDFIDALNANGRKIFGYLI